MSELRQMLEMARRAYGRERYPGDLAREVLGARPVRRKARGWTVVAVAGGLAACVSAGVLVLPWHRPAERERGEVAVALGMDLTIPGPPKMPEGMSVVPEGGPVAIGGMPGFGSMYASDELDDTYQEKP